MNSKEGVEDRKPSKVKSADTGYLFAEIMRARIDVDRVNALTAWSVAQRPEDLTG